MGPRREVAVNPDPLHVDEDDPVRIVKPPDLGDSPTYWTTPGRRDFALLLAAAGVIALILLVAAPMLTRGV